MTSSTLSVIDLYKKDFPGVRLQDGGDTLRGPCPQCGGRDRFGMFKHGGYFICRKCGVQGNAVEYLKLFHNMTIQEACAHLDYKATGGSMKQSAKASSSAHQSIIAPQLPKLFDPDLWQKQAAIFLAECQAHLEDKQSLAYLQVRHIDLVTAKHVGFGFNHCKRVFQCKAWGINSDKETFTVPAGLAMPIHNGTGGLANIELRCVPKFLEHSHWNLKGCDDNANFILRSVAYGLPEYHETTLVFESILDGLFAWQEAQGCVSVVCTRGATKKLDERARRLLNESKFAVLCPDGDKAGVDALTRWAELRRDIMAAPVVGGKDLTDMHGAALQGLTQALSIWQWFEQCVWRRIKAAEQG